MKHTMFKHEGNAIILHDWQKNAYVGIAYVRTVNGAPEFATFSSKVTSENPYQYCLLFIIESLTVGLQDRGFVMTAPIPLQERNRAMITGDGEGYAVGVADGRLHYACRAEGLVSDDMMALALARKMRCPDRE